MILEKTPHSEIRTEVFPLLFNAFDSATIQVQVREPLYAFSECVNLVAISEMTIFQMSECFSNVSLLLRTEQLCSYRMDRQGAALIAVINSHGWIDEYAMQKIVLPKIKLIYDKNNTDFKMVVNVLLCIELIMNKLERTQVGFSW